MVDSSNSTDNVTDDAILLVKAEEFYGEERLLKAAEVLKQVKDQEKLFSDHHKMILRWAETVERSIQSMLKDPESNGSPWIKQTEKHGQRDFRVFYQVSDDNQLIARIDCAIESNLLVPFLSVLNESDLYASWMPSWEKPVKLGFQLSEKLKLEGRGKQTIHVRAALMWPLSDRDLFFRVMAVDAIEDSDGCIAIQALSQTSEDDPIIPKPTGKAVQMGFSNFFLIRACPSDHPCMTRSKHYAGNDHEPPILISMTMSADPRVKILPQSLQNFLSRTVLGRMWSTLLEVAEDVRDGNRPEHKEAIDAKPDLYDWIEKRVGVMLDNIEKHESQTQST